MSQVAAVALEQYDRETACRPRRLEPSGEREIAGAHRKRGQSGGDEWRGIRAARVREIKKRSLASEQQPRQERPDAGEHDDSVHYGGHVSPPRPKQVTLAP